jgi:hypothetical protein
MPIYFMSLESFDFDAAAGIFAFDCELREQRTDSYQWTQHPIEGGAIVSDYGSKEPVEYVVSGLVVGNDPSSGIVEPTRVSDIHARLIEVADERSEITLVSGYWVEPVVIVRVRALNDVNTGDAIDVEVVLRTVVRPLSEFVRIPPALLAPPQAPGSSSAPGGSTPATEADTSDAAAEKERTMAATAFDYLLG